MAATLAELRTQCEGLFGKSPDYVAKQLHKVPDAPVIGRESFILGRCKGKVVLDIGASGPMHDAICQVAKTCYGIDRHDAPGVTGIDLDDYHAQLPNHPDVEVVVCGEVIEHLSNPGWFLKRLRAYRCPTIITVPNAFTEGGRRTMAKGYECVNDDHVAWYSYTTLKELLRRFDYEIKEYFCYNGVARFSEGLIVVTE